MKRGAKKTNVERILQMAAIPYTTYEFDGKNGQLHAGEIARSLGFPPSRVFKTLVTENVHHVNAVFVIPANAVLDLKKAARAAHEKQLAMLPLAQLFPLTGYHHGGCSPIGMRKHFPTFIDVSAQTQPTICLSGGQIGLMVETDPLALARLIPAVFSDLCQSGTTL